MVLEPEVGEEALYYHHGNTHKEGIGDAELRLEIEAIISKQSATDDRLEKVVGQTHLAKLAQERRKRLRVYTIVDFSFIRTFAPSF